MIPCRATAGDVAVRVTGLRRRIEAAGGDPSAVTIVAVTKGFDRAAVDAAVGAGLVDLGENYAQELVAKATLAGPRWHMIGRLQRNKVRSLASLVALWQSVDRPELGVEIARRAAGAAVLVQVNTSGEDQKGGCAPTATRALVADLLAEGSSVEGLMTVASGAGGEQARACFRVLRQLADDLGLPSRSMGMSSDLEEAVAEATTMVRAGTAPFGPHADGEHMRN